MISSAKHKQVAPARPQVVGSRARVNRVWLMLLLFVTTVMAYLPAMSGGVLWDDDAHITRPELQSIAGLWRIWFDFRATQQYYPLLHSAFWLEHHLWGGSMVAYHLLNVALHAMAACLFALVLQELKLKAAWVGAFIFALHPVCVESVAWISEQKNTLSTVFYLSAMLLYLHHDEEAARRGTRVTRNYFLAKYFSSAAILTKTVTVTLPAALLVIIWYKRGRLSWQKDVVPLLPWFAIAMAVVWSLFGSNDNMLERLGTTTRWASSSAAGSQAASSGSI